MGVRGLVLCACLFLPFVPGGRGASAAAPQGPKEEQDPVTRLVIAIEDAIRKAAPDLIEIEAEGVAEPPPRPAAFVPLSALQIPEKT